MLQLKNLVEGSSFQLNKNYTLDVYRAYSMIRVNGAIHSG